MNPVLLATIRRHWQLAGGVAICLVLLGLHAFWFLPTVRRYEAAQKALQPFSGVESPGGGGSTVPLPPAVFSLVTLNSLPGREASEKGNSGQLTVTMLEDLTSLAQRAGSGVMLTEPGPVTTNKRTIELRAHLKLRGGYPEFVRFLDGIERSGKLDAIERFTLTRAGDEPMIELWMKRLVLQRPAERP